MVMHLLPALVAFLATGLMAGPVLGWSFSTNPLCTLTHDAGSVRVVVTHDPAIPEYAIALTLAEATWPQATAFGIQFRGGRELSIGTDRHELSDGDRTLSVRDSGFGNVLDGLEFNTTARAVAGAAVAGSMAIDIPLQGAAEPVRAFRACAGGASLS
jgi:hypothetical protein